MSIWFNEIETAATPAPSPEAARRERLQQTLERLHKARQQGEGPDCALVVIDAQRQGEQSGNATEAQQLLRQALQRSGRKAFALRNGQFGVLLPVRGSAMELQVLINALRQAINAGAEARYQLLFGAALASETKLGASGWLSLADLRMQTRQDRLGLQGDQPRGAQERRRYSASSSPAARPRAVH